MPHSNRLLVVDDNAATRYAVRRTLERHGYTVEEVGTGGEGLQRIADNEYGAVILDVNLPDMSGFDVVRQLRTEARTRLLPVVHVSAASIATGDMITGLDAGADAYLIHPVDQDVLLATLRTLLRVRRAEDALRVSEARFREIFENIGAPIAVVDADLKAHDANDAFIRLLGDIEQTDTLPNRLGDQPEMMQALKQALGQRERWRGTFSLLTAAGLRMTEWRVAPYRDPNLGLLFIEDITQQHQREREHRQELDNTKSQLAQAQKMEALGKLTGGIAHDFNNLLTSIISGLDMITLVVADGELDKVPQYAALAIGSAHRASSLTQRMLAFARKQSLDPRPFDLAARIRSLEDMLQRSVGENIKVTLELPTDALVAVADANQFENVVLNLVINARDALGGKGSIRIVGEVAACRDDPELTDGDYVRVRVIDDGCGIDPAVLDKVFEPFFTTKAQGEGTGLGLSMAYGFARQSGGDVRIQSTPGKGTCVELFLPHGELAITNDAEPERALSPNGRAERLLLVDDTEAVRSTLRDVLVHAGYRVTDVGDAQEALVHLRSDQPFDLLLSDVGLPGMNGRELADAAHALRPDLPVLFITGYSERAEVQQEFLGPNMALLLKPFNVADLLHNVRTMLG